MTETRSCSKCDGTAQGGMRMASIADFSLTTLHTITATGLTLKAMIRILKAQLLNQNGRIHHLHCQQLDSSGLERHSEMQALQNSTKPNYVPNYNYVINSNYVIKSNSNYNFNSCPCNVYNYQLVRQRSHVKLMDHLSNFSICSRIGLLL